MIPNNNLTTRLEEKPLTFSAPCRVDLGGTLDIKTFFLPLAALNPVTFNLAVDLRTRVTLRPYRQGRVKVCSRGFDSAEFPVAEAPFAHPLGLIFAVAAYFSAAGVQIDIDSQSPPKSALGGSSAATVALVAAFMSGLGEFGGEPDKKKVVLTAHALEESVARVPCGLQDQLAAAYGGVNAWHWKLSDGRVLFERKELVSPSAFSRLEECLLLAYCGVPHESRDINGRWIEQFLKGENRSLWHDIIGHTTAFCEALSRGDLSRAVTEMNREVDLRKEMTCDVFDDMGEKLVHAARASRCGARFTGAGGGGCVWAVGRPDRITRLKEEWRDILSARKEAGLLEARIDGRGVET